MTGPIARTCLGLAILAGAAALQPARAQSLEERMANLHTLCDRGDRRACVRFGMLLQQNQEREGMWRHNHPEYYWWER